MKAVRWKSSGLTSQTEMFLTPLELSKAIAQSKVDWQLVPQTWSGSCKAPVAEVVIRATDNANLPKVYSCNRPNVSGVVMGNWQFD